VLNGDNQMQAVPLSSAVRLNPGLYYAAFVVDTGAPLDGLCSDIRDVLLNPASVSHGLKWYREALGGYVIPPAVASPVRETDRFMAFWQAFRVSVVP
jgi:hypothetical protein